MGIGNLFQKDLCQHTSGLPALLYSCQATVYPHLLRRLLNTHRQVWLNLLWGTAPFSQILVCTRSCLCPQESVPVIKSHWPPKLNSLQFYRPFARSPDWDICCGPYNFLNSVRIFWYNCSAVCGSSAWFYGE